MEKKIQAKFFVYSLDGHSSGIKKKIQDGIRDNLEGNEQGIDVLINFLDSIDWKEENVKKQDFYYMALQNIANQKIPGMSSKRVKD